MIFNSIVNSENILEIILTVVSLMGTFGGTYFGWWLGTRKRSIINIVVDNIIAETKKLHEGNFMNDNCKEMYLVRFRIRIHNSGDINGVLRNLTVKYYEKDIGLYLSTPVICAQTFNHMSYKNYNKLELININPNVSEDIECLIILDKKPKGLPFLFYMNEKNKEVNKCNLIF